MPTSIEPAEKHLLRLQVGSEVIVALTITYLENGGNESENQNIVLFRERVKEPQRLSSWLPASIESDQTNASIVLWKNDFSLEASLGVFMPHRYLVSETGLEEQPLYARDFAALRQAIAAAVARIEAPGCKIRFSSGKECARLDEVKALATLVDAQVQ